MAATRTYNLVFSVCHPDDEALWIGGLLCELGKLSFVRTYVVCLSGKDENSPRVEEFAAACKVAKCAGSVILGFPLRPAPHPLPDIAQILREGLARLQLEPSAIDLVITHSSYGDEHKHPHHRQAFCEIGQWCLEEGIPFGYFSCVQLTWLRHISIMTDLRRSGTLHLLNLSRCEDVFEALAVPQVGREVPKYYLQFLSDADAKARMLACYPSINLEMHARGYAMFTSACEALYLSDDRGLEPFKAVINAMAVPADCELLPSIDLPRSSKAQPLLGLLARIKRGLLRVAEVSR